MVRTLTCQLAGALLLAAQLALVFHVEGHDQPALDVGCVVCVHAPAAVGPGGCVAPGGDALAAARHEPPPTAPEAPRRTLPGAAQARAPPVVSGA